VLLSDVPKKAWLHTLDEEPMLELSGRVPYMRINSVQSVPFSSAAVNTIRKIEISIARRQGNSRRSTDTGAPSRIDPIMYTYLSKIQSCTYLSNLSIGPSVLFVYLV
jgi:hypothetical protein